MTCSCRAHTHGFPSSARSGQLLAIHIRFSTLCPMTSLCKTVCLSDLDHNSASFSQNIRLLLKIWKLTKRWCIRVPSTMFRYIIYILWRTHLFPPKYLLPSSLRLFLGPTAHVAHEIKTPTNPVETRTPYRSCWICTSRAPSLYSEERYFFKISRFR